MDAHPEFGDRYRRDGHVIVGLKDISYVDPTPFDRDQYAGIENQAPAHGSVTSTGTFASR